MLHRRVDLYRDFRIGSERRTELRERDQAGEEFVARQVLVRGYIRDVLTGSDLGRRHIITCQVVYAVRNFQDLEGLILVLGLLADRIGPAAREGNVIWRVTELRRSDSSDR